MSGRRMDLIIDPDGTGHCLYSEILDLRSLGPIECRRASHIEFDQKSQRWQVLTPDRSKVLFSWDSRKGCENWERSHLQPE